MKPVKSIVLYLEDVDEYKGLTWALFSEEAAKRLTSVFSCLCGQVGHCGDTFHRLNWSAGYLGQLATWDRWCQSQGKRADSQGAPGERGCLTSGGPGGPLWACCD